ncbi:hypothetical protein ACLRDC_07425 [Gluconacetobacter sacchari]|uniref:ABC transmembrane type-1 domain-containing protein n=2 Tax=Gluconacetobacter sacchari TaxID=92759 RepID=A0A7W4IE71_9PROT|nr:hypothetical protein [Gluconacetobacter sacchari]MBB2161266.1 hypothetical protein [Gluconacetobacter sacchari]GBQ23707.1 hypothetical protein AA12717_1572 [Gluconacetobacter sacchari DSM 12717]
MNGPPAGCAPVLAVTLLVQGVAAAMACGFGLLMRTRPMGRRVLSGATVCALALAIPGWMGAVALAGPWRGGGMASVVIQAVCVVPLVLLPLLRGLDRLPPGLARTARGLGAGRGARLRGLWLPLLGPAVLAAAALAVAGAVMVGVLDG